jgi:hypothetical protein
MDEFEVMYDLRFDDKVIFVSEALTPTKELE